MPGKESKFEAVKLRTMITEGKTAQQIIDAFGINQTTLKAHLLKLMQMDEKFYSIEGKILDVNKKIEKVETTGLGLTVLGTLRMLVGSLIATFPSEILRGITTRI